MSWHCSQALVEAFSAGTCSDGGQVCAVEIDPYCRNVLLARQNDGSLAPFPVWDDVRTFDGKPWRGIVDVVSGGFPCQDISIAGKGAGLSGERSGLWREMARIIGEVRPRFVYVENSPMLVGRGLIRVLADLADMGFDARWGVVGAHHVGAPHKRDRLWIRATMADANTTKRRANAAGGNDDHGHDAGWQKANGESRACREDVADSDLSRRNAGRPGLAQGWPEESALPGDSGESGGRIARWPAEPDVGRMAHGVPSRVDRLKALGNGQVPRVAARAWGLLT